MALSSGHVLDGLVRWVIHHSDRDQLVMRFYAHYDFRDKTPGDVFGLVELANRRLDRILAAARI